MLGAAIIVFREAIEAGLIVGIAMAATRGVLLRGRWIAGGVLAGALGAGLIGLFAAHLTGAFNGAGQELFNATILFLAVLMLVWHNAWMASHGREMARELRAVGQAVVRGEASLIAIALVCGLAVLREGMEVVLFLAGIAAGGTDTPAAVALGALGGLSGGGLISLLIYRGLLAVPLRHFFTATGVLITLLAAGLSSQAVNFLHQAGVIDGLDTPLWDSSNLVASDSLSGRVLQTLIGYTDRPDAAQVFAYTVTVLLMVVCIAWARRAVRG